MKVVLYFHVNLTFLYSLGTYWDLFSTPLSATLTPPLHYEGEVPLSASCAVPPPRDLLRKSYTGEVERERLPCKGSHVGVSYGAAKEARQRHFSS